MRVYSCGVVVSLLVSSFPRFMPAFAAKNILYIFDAPPDVS